MTDTQVIAVAVILAVLIVVALAKPARRMVGGIFERDRKGRIVLVLTPTPRPKKKRRRRT